MSIGNTVPAGIIILILLSTGSAQAQRKKMITPEDSSFMLNQNMDSITLSDDIKTIYLDSAILKRPKIAAYLAAALPGLGQIYNKNYWKLPILYGGGTAMAYFINWNNNKYHQYLQGLADKRNGVTSNLLATAPEDNLQRGIDYYRRNRDFVMIFTGVLYLIQIADAHVQAHLENFDITEDLSLRLTPIIEDSEFMTRYAGLGLVITIN
ncbi:MAG TPA: DUF5683 domain-containing protein [Cyclobacteriaceae bacterium]|nr:DUF5683 domain-containing protein [Cyclobacteriaceae bacterium]